MYFFHSNLDFRILPFTISIYTKIARTRQSNRSASPHYATANVLQSRRTSRTDTFYFCRTPALPATVRQQHIRARIRRLLPHGPENIFRDFSEAVRHRRAYKSVSSKDPRARAIPERSADRPRLRASASQTSGAACALLRERRFSLRTRKIASINLFAKEDRRGN